jgi:hypothetical protein
MREQMNRTDLRRVRGAKALTDPNDPAWRLVPAAIRAQGVSAFSILTG